MVLLADPVASYWPCGEEIGLFVRRELAAVCAGGRVIFSEEEETTYEEEADEPTDDDGDHDVCGGFEASGDEDAFVEEDDGDFDQG